MITVYALDRTVTILCAFLLDSASCAVLCRWLADHASTFSSLKWGEGGCDVVLVCMAAVKPQVFTVQCAHRVLLLHIRRVLCVLLLVLIESLLLFRSEVAVPWVHTHSSAFGFPKNLVVLTFLSWILPRVASRAPGCACGSAEVAAALSGAASSPAPSPSDLAVHCSHRPSSCSPTTGSPSPCRGRC